MARGLHVLAGVNPTDLKRPAVGASDTRFIRGIYNYCDGRCQRCRYTARCQVFQEDGDPAPARMAPAFVGSRGALQRTLAAINEIKEREQVDLATIAAEASSSMNGRTDRHRRDPLVASARQYGNLAWKLAQALGPIVTARGDAAVVEAIEAIDWFSSMIGAKVFRAVCDHSRLREELAVDDPDDVMADFNGSAKVALLGIDESRRAWRVLMEEGRATADGVPAQAVRMLDELETGVLARFPRALAFVRPGFDEGASGNEGRQS